VRGRAGWCTEREGVQARHLWETHAHGHCAAAGLAAAGAGDYHVARSKGSRALTGGPRLSMKGGERGVVWQVGPRRQQRGSGSVQLTRGSRGVLFNSNNFIFHSNLILSKRGLSKL
jgi:hypothetical protein